MKNNKLLLTISILLLVTLLLVGGTYSYLQWATSNLQRGNVTFTTGSGFSCSADGGQNINQNEVELIPTSCTDSQYAIKRTIKANVVNNRNVPIYLDLWLEIEALSQGLSQSQNFSYALTTDSNSCSGSGLILSGTFNGKTVGDRVNILNNVVFNSTGTETYYLYIWLEYEGLDQTSQDQQFSLSVNGECSDMIPGTPNEPDSLVGLVPVKLSASGGTVTTVGSLEEWYDYDKKEWANAILVNDNTYTLNYYLDNSGVEVPQLDILGYFVWIPRFSYQVWSYSGSDSAGSPRQIPIKFVSKTTKDTATKIGDWQTHPAFTFGDTELAGIWVGKFETNHTSYPTTSAASLDCTRSSCDSEKYNGLRVLPNVRPLTNNSVSSFFYVSRAMTKSGNVFSLDIDTNSHMMKNSEWGAVAYLSHSKYGINGEIRNNNTNNIFYYRATRTYLTGCGAGTPNEAAEAACDIQYGEMANGFYPQSTTGNVTGVFDMSGGTNEYVMGTYNGDNDYGNSSSSGFDSSTNQLPNAKYYDNYTNPPFDGTNSTNFTRCTLATCGGHALNETKNWHSDYATFVDSSSSWFLRGGYYSSGSNAGAFYVSDYHGGVGSGRSARMVLIASGDGPK